MSLPGEPYLRRRVVDVAARGLCVVMTVLAILPLLSLLGYVIKQGVGGLSWSFFTELPKPVGETGGGMANALAGSAILVGLACAVGMPVGILAGIYLAEFGKNRFGNAVRFCADVLSGVPSIAVGVFVYTLIVLTMRRFSALAGGVALGILMLPTVTRTTEELVRLVPDTLREAALALGVPKWKAILRVVLRTALPGIATGLMLAVARAAGETAPLLFTAFNNRFWSASLDKPMASLPVQIFTYAVSPYDDWHRQAWAAALVLVTAVLVLNVAARLVVYGENCSMMLVGAEVPAGASRKESMAPPETQDHKMRTDGLRAWFGRSLALKGINLAIADKKVTAIIGPSGCGKSTFIRCLNRMHEVIPGARVEGTVLLDGRPIYGPTVDPVRIRRRVGMVFQKPNPFPTMSIRENVLAGAKLNGLRLQDPEALVERALKQAALWEEVKDKLSSSGMSLSGGQQQRLCIARALALEPEVMLMDEPCSALDPIATARVEELIHEIGERLTIAIVTHNMQQAARVSDFTAFFLMGELVEYAETDALFTKPQDSRTEDYITGRFG